MIHLVVAINTDTTTMISPQNQASFKRYQTNISLFMLIFFTFRFIYILYRHRIAQYIHFILFQLLFSLVSFLKLNFNKIPVNLGPTVVVNAHRTDYVMTVVTAVPNITQ